MPALPVPVVRWFERCCAKNPDDRFQSAEETFAALRSAAEQAGPLGVAGERDETLRGHRAPLSQRNPPLGTTDSASYPGTQASPPTAARSNVWIALLIGGTGVAILAALVAFAMNRLGTRALASSAASTSAGVAVAPPANPAPLLPPAEPAPPAAPVVSTPEPPGTPEKSPKNPKSVTRPTPTPTPTPTPAPSRHPERQRPARRAPTDLGF
jgi:outer membrane biosynthesis protein TonB